MPNITLNINSIRQRIHSAALKAARNPDEITLLAVSKKQPVEAIIEAYHCGQRCFAENYLQEALHKKNQLTNLHNIEWHFIGPVQSNKTRKVAENFDWVHTIDRIKIAERLNEQRSAGLPALNICLQVNIDDESSKAGVSPSDVVALANAVVKLPRLQLRGLMTIPCPSNTLEQQHNSFAKQTKLFKQLQRHSPELASLDTLSMGMSGDLEPAIAEGSTLVRIGTNIFGTRA